MVGVFAWQLMLIENEREMTESLLGVRGDWTSMVVGMINAWKWCGGGGQS